MRGRGKRDTLIGFYSVATAENALGEPVKSGLTLIGQEWSEVFYGLGAERRAAAIEGGNQPATFNVDNNSTTRSITTANVIQLGGEVWDIVSVAPHRRNEIDFTAIRRTP